MNYRHAFHAGNFADVHKHVALVSLLHCLKRKATPFAVIDTHAGRGLYDLAAEAVRTGEATEGILKLAQHVAQTPALSDYLEIIHRFPPGVYPGSPVIAASLLRAQDRLVAIEKHVDEFEQLEVTLASHRDARCILNDGYAQLRSLLPPAERRGLIVVDPPYEDADEVQNLVAAFAAAYRRFPNGAYLIWYPLKSAIPAEALVGELKNAGVRKLVFLLLDVGSRSRLPSHLSASALFVVNPPYGFDTEMRAAQAELLPLLRRNADAGARMEWLAGGP